MVERFHRELKTALMCHPGMSWVQSLPLVLLGIRNSFKDDLNACPAELVYGESLRLRGEFFKPSKLQEVSTEFVTRLKPQMTPLSPVSVSSQWQNSGTFVLLTQNPTKLYLGVIKFLQFV